MVLNALQARIILLFTAFFLSFFDQNLSAKEEESLVICLESEKALLSAYMLPWKTDASVEASIVNMLRDVFVFDLSQNGSTTVVNNTSVLDGQSDPLSAVSMWKKNGIFYVFQTEIKNRELFIKVLLVNTQTIKVLDNISLTGQLKADRRTMHRLADRIHQAIFGEPGIASTHLLFSLKTSLPNDAAGKKKWKSEIYECDYDGANLRQVTKNSGYAVMPIYVPPKDGFASGSLMYVSYQTGQSKIYFMPLQGGEPSRLTSLPANQLMPAISKQRDKIAFISDVTGNPDLFVQAFHPEKGMIGKPQQIFSAKQASQGSPTINPEGNKVAFVSNKDGSPRIYILDIPKPGTLLKDMKPKLITKRSRESTAPQWSPDGKLIAYTAMTEGVRQIWTYDVSSGEEKQITGGSGHKENPTWAPNSLHLAFNSTGNNKSEIYIINLNQTKAICITSGLGEKSFPCWEVNGISK